MRQIAEIYVSILLLLTCDPNPKLRLVKDRGGQNRLLVFWFCQRLSLLSQKAIDVEKCNRRHVYLLKS